MSDVDQTATPPNLEPTDETPDTPGWLITFEWGFIFWMLYILSIGPMYWHWYIGKFANGSYWIALFYEPLWQLAERFPPFGDLLDYYVRLWIFW